MGAKQSQSDSDDCSIDQSNWQKQQYYTVKPEEIDKWPCQNIGFLLYSRQMTTAYGTGFMVSSDTVVTAAHNVFDKYTRKIRSPIYFYPGVSGKLQQRKEYLVEEASVYCPSEYTNATQKPKKRYDYAFLKLNTPVAFDNANQPFIIGRNFDKINQPSEITLFSYPKQEIYKNSPYEGNNYTVFLKGLIANNISERIKQVDCNKGIIYHLMPSDKGSSGAPLLAKILGRNIVIGLVKGSSQKKACNIALLFTNQLCYDLYNWQFRSKANPAKFLNLQVLTWKPQQFNFSIETNIANEFNQIQIKCKASGKGSFQTRSQSILKLKSMQNTIHLSFGDAFYSTNKSYIIFGILLDYTVFEGNNQSIRQHKVMYKTAIQTRQNIGKIASGDKTIQNWIQPLFLAKGQIVELTLNIDKKILSFAKEGVKKYDIFLPQYCSFSDAFIFTQMAYPNDSITVQYFKN